MLRAALALCALSAALAYAQEPAPSAAAAAGVIDFVEGDGLVEGKDGKTRIARAGDSVYPADTVTTFPKAELHIKMADGAYFSVRENTKLTITEYVANGDEGDRSLIDLARGAFRSITGWIGKNSRSNYQVRTPMVTIGVRGTDHEPTHLLPGDPRGEPGSYDKVNEGRTVMRSPRGSTEITPNRAAFFHTDHRQAPRVLASVPAFFRPARNEQRFHQQAQASVRTLDTQRAARREAFMKSRGLDPAKAAPRSQVSPEKTPPAGAKDRAVQKPAPKSQPTYAPGSTPSNKGIPQTPPRREFSPEKAPKPAAKDRAEQKAAMQQKQAERQKAFQQKKEPQHKPPPAPKHFEKKFEKGGKKKQ